MPQYTRSVDCSHNLRAALDENGVFTVRARSRTAYADGAVASAEVTVPNDYAEAIRIAMAEALEAVSAPLAEKVDRAAAVTLDHATRMGDFA